MEFDFRYIKEQLKKELQNPLPGIKVHQKMVPPERLQDSLSESVSAVQSSVLLILFPDNEELKILFIRRPSTMKYHPGQIAFPGGRHEPEDVDLQATAIRETDEEIGISRDRFEILGELSPLYVMVSNFRIHSFIAWTDSLPPVRINHHEVEELIALPVRKLSDQTSIQVRKIETSLGLSEFPGFHVDNHFIWGATAMILSEFLEIYNRIIS